jgi:NADH:ubiquinone oxidoreductase subunit E
LIARRVALASGFAVAVCVAILLSDYAVARWRAPRDDRLIKTLQQQVRTEAALAPNLAAEQGRVTAARIARKNRDDLVAWALIAAAAIFLTSVKRVLPPSVSGAGPRPAAGSQPAHHRLKPVPHKVAQASACDQIDLAFIDDLVAKQGRTPEAAIPILQAIQTHYRYLPDEALRRVCELTEITPAQIAGTASFYGQFRRSPAGRHVVRICHGTACHVAGARQVTEELRRYLAIAPDADTDPARMFTLDEVACVGCCSLAPVLVVDGQTAGRLTPASACDALEPFEAKESA